MKLVFNGISFVEISHNDLKSTEITNQTRFQLPISCKSLRDMSLSSQHSALSFSKEPPLPPIEPSAVGNQTAQIMDDSVNSGALSKLSNVEAQRIMSVLNEIQRKVLLVGLLPDHLDRRTANIFTGELYTTLLVRHINKRLGSWQVWTEIQVFNGTKGRSGKSRKKCRTDPEWATGNVTTDKEFNTQLI